MPRWPMRVITGLLVLHGALGFVVAPQIFPHLSPELLGFAQHGFAFIFLALLNLAVWQSPARTRGVRVAVHVSNVSMLAFYILWCVVKPEAPNYVGAVLLLLVSVLALLSDAATARDKVVASIGGFATGKFTTPEEVATLVVMLASERTANVTGTNFVIDGGLIKTL